MVNRDHGRIVAGGILVKAGDMADDVKTCIAPEVALDETDI
jgi:hypothetical protein